MFHPRMGINTKFWRPGDGRSCGGFSLLQAWLRWDAPHGPMSQQQLWGVRRHPQNSHVTGKWAETTAGQEFHLSPSLSTSNGPTLGWRSQSPGLPALPPAPGCFFPRGSTISCFKMQQDSNIYLVKGQFAVVFFPLYSPVWHHTPSLCSYTPSSTVNTCYGPLAFLTNLKLSIPHPNTSFKEKGAF